MTQEFNFLYKFKCLLKYLVRKHALRIQEPYKTIKQRDNKNFNNEVAAGHF